MHHNERFMIHSKSRSLDAVPAMAQFRATMRPMPAGGSAPSLGPLAAAAARAGPRRGSIQVTSPGWRWEMPLREAQARGRSDT